MAKRRYSNGKITVFWDSEKCIRSGKCDGQLPQVFNPGKRPWVDLSAADAETIARVIDTCPTGALSYELPGRAGRAGHPGDGEGPLPGERAVLPGG